MDPISGSIPSSSISPQIITCSPVIARCPVTDDTVRCPVTRNHIIEVMTGRFKCEDSNCRCHRAARYYGDVLYDSVFRMVYSIAKKFKHSLHENIEDLAQTCFERIIKNLDNFNPDRGEFTTWSWRVSENVLRHKCKIYRRRMWMFVEMNETVKEPIAEEVEKLPMFQIDINEAVISLKDKYPQQADILNIMFGKQKGELEYHSVADVARTTGRKYNEVLRFVSTVVRPFFISRLNMEVSNEY